MAAIEVRTFSDMYTAVMEELKYQSGDTTSRDRIKRDLNAAYLGEVVPAKQWEWLRVPVQHTVEPKQSLTATCTAGSPNVTLGSAPTVSLRGYQFNVEGTREVYEVRLHSAGSTSLTLVTEYAGSSVTLGTASAWRSRVPLPTDIISVASAYCSQWTDPMVGLGVSEMQRRQAAAPFLEGAPQWYALLPQSESAPYGSVTSLPATASRSSDRYLRTIVFNASVASYLSEGDRIRVSSAGHYAYNVDSVIISVATTTITFSAPVNYNESSTADTGMSVTRLGQRKANEEYRELSFYPARNSTRSVLTISGVRRAAPMVDDTDEPLIPLEDRVVLVYHAKHTAWSRERNPEEAARNFGLYGNKLSDMKARVQSGQVDQPRMEVRSEYLQHKRMQRQRARSWRWF